MNGIARVLAIATMLAFGGQCSEVAAQSVPKLRIAHSTWIGYGALYVAKEKGYFTEAGVDVEPTIIEASSDAIAAMAGGRLDAVASTIDNFALFTGNGAQLSVVLALDESHGGDGIVGKKDIAGVAGLKGRTVAVQHGSVSQFLLAQALDKVGLSDKDVNEIDMKSGDAGAAFVAGRVDAAVTWEPWLSKAKATDFGKILIDTKSLPGLIVDALAVRPEYMRDNPKAVEGLVRGYFKAIAFLQANPAEAKEIIARNLKMTPASLDSSWNDVMFFGKAENLSFFVSPTGGTSPALELAKNAGSFYARIGVLKKAPAPEAMIAFKTPADN
ncbi:ABC transporter substrate-binding protein [Methylocapsa sp. S129]|uniref:ABC transporter substrate-binding protein n=1 Tax=Methylocapsa sp. S129 TaxID=1641869 RepID=UPI00131AF4EC|nr:ABC transporter substrate-binding protein [Methylocapsa sp. S129]